ncbi:hypothetical protein [Paenibacillus agri]|uniref:Uncharacterized protein n=1 Tax=Paenibacillus agri TaxID=2744309 RepID=A0A850EL42_9BACL|nr:hypothetical protein [Paenibacillus agri]NUU61745.1 hypothetical protein [Paenibacillus agri]
MTGLILFVALIVLSIRYPGTDSWMNILLNTFGIPLYSKPETRTGLQYSGVLSLILLLTSIAFFNMSLSRHRLLLFIVFMILLTNVPDWLVSSYQRMFASGVYALELKPEEIRCSFKLEGETYNGQCQLPVRNYSASQVAARAVLQPPKHEGHPLAGAIIHLPTLELLPHDRTRYNAEFKLPVTGNPGMESGELSGFSITLIDKKHSRTWEQ